MAPGWLLARSRPLVGLPEKSSNSRTGSQVQMLQYTPATFRPRTVLLMEPRQPPFPRSASLRGLREAPARSFPVEIPRAARIKGSPSPRVHGKGLVLLSCTIRGANLPLFDGSSGILRLGISQSGCPLPALPARRCLQWSATQSCQLLRSSPDGVRARPFAPSSPIVHNHLSSSAKNNNAAMR
jgi:hypothetical protein